MKLILLNAKKRYRAEDLQELEKAGAIFYEQKSNKLEDIKEINDGEPFILGVNPGWVEGSWNGLPWEKVKQLHNLKGLCVSTTAYGWVPFKKLREWGIPVANVPGKSTDAVGEYYVFLMVALLRKLATIIKNNWEFTYGPDVLGRDAKGLTAGIIGLGEIGSKIAELCKVYGMDVIYWSRNKKDVSYQFIELDTLCRTSDVIFLTTVADDSTRNLINKEKIDLMKKDAIFLSPIDSFVYDKEYLIEKIAKNEFGGLGYESDEKIGQFKGNVLSVPEVAYYTKQTLDNESRIMTESMLGMLKGKLVNIVNM